MPKCLELCDFVVLLRQLVNRACGRILVAAEKASKTIVQDSGTKNGSNDTGRKTGCTNAFGGVLIVVIQAILSSP